MKIFFTGGTGFVGSYFTKRFLEKGHEVTVLTRSLGKSREGRQGAVHWVEGDSVKPGKWQDAVAGHDAVINLAGAGIFTPWTNSARKMIEESRIFTTRNVADAIGRAGGGGSITLLSTSAVGYYGGHLDDRILDENSPPGKDFLAGLGVKWEQEALRAEESGARVALCRFGIVLGRNGGALSRMLPAFKRYLGSHIGSGRQWFPWIHLEDLFRIAEFLLEKSDIKGPFNCTAPNPVTNKDFGKALARALGTSVVLPGVPALVIKMALGDFSEVILKGQRAVPRRLLDAGFEFQFPHIDTALADLLN